MKSILLHINNDSGEQARLQVALDLARSQAGNLICTQIMPYTGYVLGDPTASYVTTGAFIEEAERQARAHRERVEERLSRESVPWEWRYFTGEPAATIIAQARLADIIILSRAARTPEPLEPPPLVGDVVMHARTPVLAVPPEASGFNPNGAAVIAWNGSREAATAVRAALPLLRNAATVRIVGVAEADGRDFPATELSRYLAQHGITSKLFVREPKVDEPVGETLMAACGAVGAAYLVAGAYGHSRVREFLFGGVTRWLLGQSGVPLLLAH